VDHIEPVKRECHHVSLVERERVPGLRADVNAGHVEPGLPVAHGGAAFATA
jgi:hypothetical protein